MLTISLRLLRTIVLFLMFLELFFWLGGYSYQTYRQWMNHVNFAADHEYRILCIGESMTMDGTPFAYPIQLERILNQQEVLKPIRVINQGVGGINTGGIKNNLEKWLNEYQPQMVIAMIGSMDPTDNKPLTIFPEWITHVKIWQLINWLKDRVALHFFPPAIIEENFMDVDTEIELFQSLFAQQSQEQRARYFLTGVAMQEGNIDLADELFAQFLDNNRDQIIHRFVYKKYAEFLIEVWRLDKFIKIMHEVPSTSWGTKWIDRYCVNEQHARTAHERIESLIQQGKEPASVYGFIASCYEHWGDQRMAALMKVKMTEKSSYYHPNTRQNYLAIKDMLLNRSIVPVFVQYPTRPIESLMSIFVNDPRVNQIVFVDNEHVFKKALTQKGYDYCFKDRTLGDIGHATKECNEVLANNIAQQILVRDILPKKLD